MRKLWYFAFYGLCAFTIAFSLYWLAAVPALPRGAAPSNPGSSLPSARAGASAPGVPETPAAQEEGYYLCDEGGRLAVYRCDAAGVPRARLELTDIYVNLLPEADALRFKAGYYVWDRQALERLLEDLGA